MSEKDPHIKFKSGATSSAGHDEPYWLTTGHGEKVTALRSGYGNKKHEDGRTVISTMNWLQAFHSRDLEFFRNRYIHARDHLDNELKGRFDTAPGGNLGGVGWFVDRMAFIKANDYDFYLSIVGLKPHPGERMKDCSCEYCSAGQGSVPCPPELCSPDYDPKAGKFFPADSKLQINFGGIVRCGDCGKFGCECR